VTGEDAIAELLRHLKAAEYHFTAVTPATHARVLERPAPAKLELRDIFGWNRSFGAGHLDERLLALLEAADALEQSGGQLRSKVRVASLDAHLFAHGAFPTTAPDAVFFGPDTYRFVRFVQRQLGGLSRSGWLVDMGSGCGAGGIMSADGFGRVTLVDVNPSALSLARANAAAGGVQVETLASDAIPKGASLVIANPPYMMDADARQYRDGGALLGGAVALDWCRQALEALAPGGTFLLYSGAAYVRGESPVIAAVEQLCGAAGASLAIEEIDPDIFGEELAQPAYAQVERIAAIGAVITLR